MLVGTERGFEHFLRWLKAQPVVALDTETSGLNLYRGDKMVGVSVGNGEHSYYLPFRHGQGPNLPEKLITPLVTTLQDRHLLMHNAGFDLRVLANEGWDIDRIEFQDTMVAEHLIDETLDSYALKKLADHYGIGSGSKDEDELYESVCELMGKKRMARAGANSWKGHMWKLPSSLVEPYACADVDLTWALWKHQQPRIEATTHLQQFSDLEDIEPNGLYWSMMDYIKVIAKIEHRGLVVDRDLLLYYKEDGAKHKAELLAELRLLAKERGFEKWEEFNPGSPVQPRMAFGWENCRAEYLEELGTKEAELTLDYKAYDKAETSYYDAYLQRIGEDNVLHPNFKVIGTDTGRLAAENPNLQAVPRYNDRQPIKDLFVARDGHYLMEFDLSQAELRVVGYFARVPLMLKIFEEGTDLHTETAKAFGLPRDVAKRVNLSAVFGIGAQAFANKYKVPVEQAAEWLRTYHAGYPEIRAFYRYKMDEAKRQGFITLPTGRRRHYNKVEQNHYEPEGWNRGEQRASSNFIQGVVAELVRISMLRIDKDPDLDDVHMLLTVHDSILVEVPDNRDPKEIATRIIHHMTDFRDIPLDADAKYGKRWGKMTPVELEGGKDASQPTHEAEISRT